MEITKRFSSEIWRNLPAWFIYYNAVLLNYCNIAFLKEPRYDFVITFIFPYSLFLLYYYARLRNDEEIQEGLKRRYFFILTAATFSAIALTTIFSKPVKLGADWASHFDSFIWGYEASNVLFTALIAAHCFKFRGAKAFLIFYGAAFLYGMVLESGGITMGYFREDHFHFYLPLFSAPVATMFGWSTVFYPCVFLLDGVRKGLSVIGERSFVWQGVFVAAIAVMFDLQIDPFATAMGVWRWNPLFTTENTYYLFDVPIINYISWFSAVFSFGAVYYLWEFKMSHWVEFRRSLAMLASLPLILVCATIIEFTALGVIEGFNGPSWVILEDYYHSGMPLARAPKKGKMENWEHD
ncbi:MAG: hypothetical protein Kow0090_16800 [Myxococcota bacterium]